MRQAKFLLVTGIVSIVAIPSALAQDQSNPYEPCSRIADNSQRLACFDATYAREVTLRETRAQEALAREEAERERERENFGLSGAQIEQLEREQREEAVATGEVSQEEFARVEEEEKREEERDNEIKSTILEVFTDRQRNTVILLENGQIWRATSNRSYRGSIKEGWSITIKRAGFSGYRLTFDDRNGYIGVRRIR